MASRVFLVGPSRIGKSTAAQYAASKICDAVHCNLDQDLKSASSNEKPHQALIKVAKDRTWVEPMLGSYLASSSDTVVVDIGAGTQDTVSDGGAENMWLVDWLQSVGAHVVLLTADHRVAWGRWIDGRPEMERHGFDWFVGREFASRRVLYELARHEIDVTNKRPEEVGAELVAIIRSNS